MTLTLTPNTMTKREEKLENMLRKLLWYATEVYDDKPHQFWNQMRIAADMVGDAAASEKMMEYYETGCPFKQRGAQFRWVVENLLVESQLDVVPPGKTLPLRFLVNP